MIDYGVLARVEVTHNAKCIIKSWISTNVFSVAYIIEYMIFLIPLKLITNICVKQTRRGGFLIGFCFLWKLHGLPAFLMSIRH